MKIGIQTWGSHGDIRPFVSLADGLQAAGHDVTLVVTCVDSDRYSDLHPRTGYELRVVATPVVPDRALLEKIGDRLLRERNAIEQTRIAIEQLLLPAEDEMFRAAERLCSENDLVIGHYFLYPLSVAAKRQGCPRVSVALVHGAVPSRFQPPSGVPDLGTLCNRATWWIARFVLNNTLKSYPDRLRSRHGLEPARDMIDSVWSSDQLTLLAVSPTICERKPDWAGYYQVCGTLDGEVPIAEGSVSDALRAFLLNGPRPVYMTFGSAMSGCDEKATIALLTGAASAASMRAVIQAPNWDSLGFESTDDVHYVRSAPHSEVFPRCELIVHHGGAGTSHAALRAGKPSVVVAHTAEQELWGRELRRVGAAHKLLRRKTATPRRLSQAIQRVANSPRIHGKAESIGARVVKEDGVASAVRLIAQRFAP